MTTVGETPIAKVAITSGIVVSVGNSTTVPLAAGATWVGTAEDVTPYQEIDVNLAGLPTVCPGSLFVEFSPDGVHWDVSIQVSGAQLAGPNIVPQYLRIVLPNFRLRYVNGGTLQTELRITTVYHRTGAMRLTRFLNQTIDNTEGVELTKAVLSGIRPDGTYGNVPVDKNNLLQVAIATVSAADKLISADRSVFGSGIVEPRITQVKADFLLTFQDNDVAILKTGTAVEAQSGGLATFSTGAGVTASISAISNRQIRYSPAREIYAMLTAAFTTPTNANSNQRAGIYDSGNGFFLGYQGTVFGITVRNAGVDTFTPQANFNIDTLMGGTLSLFTRGGVPEALIQTDENVYRIRFGWLGAAPISFQVMAPDGGWVTFHQVRQPNTSPSPSVANPNLPITFEVTKTGSDATNLVVSTSSWDGGIVSAQPAFVSTTDASTGISSHVSSLRDVVIGTRNRLFGDNFVNGIGTGTDAGTFPTSGTTTGSGSVGVVAGALGVRTGVTLNSTASIASLLTSLFKSGNESGQFSALAFPTTPAQFRIASRGAGVDTYIDSSSFNGQSPTTDANYHLYDLYFNGQDAFFFQAEILLHTLRAKAAVLVRSLDLGIRFEAVNFSTTIAAGSAGATLPQAVISVASTAGFPTVGTIFVTTGAGVQTVRYTGIAGNAFTGCTGGTGLMALGGAVGISVLRWGQFDVSNGFFFECSYQATDVALNVIETAALQYGQPQVDIQALTRWQTAQTVIGTSAVQIASSALSSRRTITLKASTGNNQNVAIGPTNAVTANNGYLLHDTDTIDLDLYDGAQVWGVGSASGQVVYDAEIG